MTDQHRIAISAVLFILGFGWMAWMGWLRHRSWKKSPPGFAPGTQHLVFIGQIGGLLFFGAALLFLILTRH